MKTKELKRRQARWAETMGCFDFEITFNCPGLQSSKPNSLSWRPDLAPPIGEKLTFGQLLKPKNTTPDTFSVLENFETWLEDETINLENAKHWFEIDVMGASADLQDNN